MTTTLLIGTARAAPACPLRMLLEALRRGQEALAEELDRTARG